MTVYTKKWKFERHTITSIDLVIADTLHTLPTRQQWTSFQPGRWPDDFSSVKRNISSTWFMAFYESQNWLTKFQDRHIPIGLVSTKKSVIFLPSKVGKVFTTPAPHVSTCIVCREKKEMPLAISICISKENYGLIVLWYYGNIQLYHHDVRLMPG